MSDTNIQTVPKRLDFFALKGYRLLALHMLKQAVTDSKMDLVGRNRAEDKETARQWLAEAGLGHENGLSFDDCVVIIGLSSAIDAFRKICLERPEEAYSRLVHAIDMIGENDSYEKTESNFLNINWSLRGSGRTNWAFGDRRPTESGVIGG